MPLPVPVLDNNDFDDLASEAQALIPRYFPAWTDRNLSDPGVTLLELFAFLMETAYYQLDRVPARTLQRFAELAGTTAIPGEPVDQLLCRAVTARAAINRAVTAADSGLVVTSGVLTVSPPLTQVLPAGTPVTALTPLPGTVTLAGAAAPGDTSLTVADASSARAGDVLLIAAAGDGPGQGAVQGQAELALVKAVGSAAGSAVAGLVTLSAPVRYGHAAGSAMTRLTEASTAQPAALVIAAQAGADIVVAEPAAGLSGAAALRLGVGTDALDVLASGIARTKVLTQLSQAEHTFPADLVSVVLVVPAGGGTPSPALLDATFGLLRARSPITTRVRVQAPSYSPVQIGATVVRALPALLRKSTVQQQAQAAIAAFLSPISGGDDGQGWEFGRPVYRSEIYQVLQVTEGIDHVTELTLNGDPTASELPLSADPAQAAVSLVQLTAASVTVVDA